MGSMRDELRKRLESGEEDAVDKKSTDSTQVKEEPKSMRDTLRERLSAEEPSNEEASDIPAEESKDTPSMRDTLRDRLESESTQPEEENEVITSKKTIDMLEGLRKADSISEAPSKLEQLTTDIKLGMQRKPRIMAEAIGGDIPVIGKYLESFDPITGKKLEPESRTEQLLSVGTRLARDLYVYAKSRGLVSGISKLPGIAQAGKVIQSVPKIGSMIADEILPMAMMGSIHGAVTADTDKVEDIVKESAKSALFMAAVPLAIKGVQAVGTPILKGASALFNKAFNKPIESFNSAKIKELVFNKVTGVQASLLEKSAFARKLRLNLSEQERELLPFIIQKTNVPTGLGRPDLQALSKDPKIVKKLVRYGRVISKQFDEAHSFYVNSGGKMSKIDNYVTQLWNTPGKTKNIVSDFFRTKSSFAKGRAIKSYFEGIEAGFKPLTLDVSKILDFYNGQVYKTAFNLRFINSLKNIKGIDGKKLILPFGKAPNNYVSLPVRILDGKKVHPEVAKYIDILINSNKPSEIAVAYDAINGLLKSTQLALSLFHPVALTESAMVFPGVGPKGAASVWNPVNIFKALKSGKFGVWKDLNGSTQAMRSGLGISAPSDVQKARVDKILERFALNVGDKFGKTAGKIAGLPLKLKQAQDWFLWEYLHPTFKLTAFHAGVSRAVAKNPNIPVERIRRSVAQLVNDTFGGQMFENLGISKQFAQNMQRVMLSPDWNISTLRQAGALFGQGNVSSITGGVRKKMAEEFWKNALVYFYIGSNLFNYYMTEIEQGEGRYMWDNPQGRETHVFWGQQGLDAEKYIRPGKQFREGPEFLTNTGPKVLSKTAPLARTIFDVKDIIEDPNLTYSEKNWEILKSSSGAFVPFGVSGVGRAESPTGLLTNVSDGMTKFSTTKFIERALVNLDIDQLMDIRKHALRNNINFDEQFSRAKRNVSADLSKPFRDKAKEIADDMFKLEGQERTDYITSLLASGELLPEIQKPLEKLIKSKLSTLKQKKESVDIDTEKVPGFIKRTIDLFENNRR